ncbi:MAG: DUF2249 domain-containing protein [Chloroflexota bacterium]|nr:DUF2249 domain-containing protein [Chloroflexota bacterium]
MTVILDVRDLPVDERLACALRRFAALDLGDVLQAVTDRNPVTWRAAFLGDHRWQAAWAPVREGPDVWMIRIVKLTRSSAA